MLSIKGLKEILNTVKTKKGAVIGDFCLDAYWKADMELSSISLETPRFPRPIIEENYSPGGGGNVSWNLSEIGFETYALTALGEDWRKALLMKELENRNINTKYVFSTKKWKTPAYIKPIIRSGESEQEDARLDFNNYSKPPKVIVNEIVSYIEENIQKLDVFIIEDQLKNGLLSNDTLRENINEIAGKYDTTFIVDSRYRISEFENMVLKCNKGEAYQILQKSDKMKSDRITPSDIKASCKKLYKKYKNPIYITSDEDGVYFFDSEDREVFKRIPTIDVSEPFDITGAGDSFMSGLAAGLIGGASLPNAGLIGNIVASISLKKVNITGTATPEEILDRFKDFRDISVIESPKK